MLRVHFYALLSGEGGSKVRPRNFSSFLFFFNFNFYKLLAATRAMSLAGLVKFGHGNRLYERMLGFE